ncbi:MAG: hypothetical protein IPG86_20705 [Chitinophagaceae bacterium]|nr:hypothetical protein [Chitinophagaceae bacterium]
MKKLKQQEKEEQQQPTQVQPEINPIVISSRTFFVTAPAVPSAMTKEYRLPFKSGDPIDRSYAFFHPPLWPDFHCQSFYSFIPKQKHEPAT